MRAKEFLHEDSMSTSSGDLATVAQPLLTQSRLGTISKSGKYFENPYWNKDQEKGTPHAVRQFKNSPGH